MATLPLVQSSASLLTVEEYLRSVYETDCDYVDGELEERNVGEYDHAFLQTILVMIFTVNREKWGVRALTELRTRVSGSRYRVPDLSVLRKDAPREQILTHPPLIAIEILSPEDRFRHMLQKIDDYLDFGVENIWILDPAERKAWTASRSGLHLAQNDELTVPGTPIRIVLSEVFDEVQKG